MYPKNVTHISAGSASKVNCSTCRLKHMCLPSVLEPSDLAQLSAILTHPRPLDRGNHLFRQGDKLSSLFIVMTGTVKSYVITADGHEQVIRFYLPGELVGLGALMDQHHPSSAVALEHAVLCELPITEIDELYHQLPSLFKYLLAATSRELVRKQESLLTVGQQEAEQRLVHFLLNLSASYKERGYSDTTFNISMSRQDIGSFLGLSTETVSRLLHRLQKNDLLDVELKHLHIRDLDKMQKLIRPHRMPSRPVAVAC